MRKTFGVEGENTHSENLLLLTLSGSIFSQYCYALLLCIFHTSDPFIMQVRKNNIQNNYILYSSYFLFAPSV